MYYPKSCFSINETVTQNAKREYDKKREIWYKTALQLYPNYYSLRGRERINAMDAIDEKCGFSV